MNKTKVIEAFNALLKEDESLKYALATNLAKYGRPQSKKSDKPADLTKGLEKGREKYVKDLKKAGLDEAAPVSIGLNMDQTDAVYKVLEDNFGEEHMKDMFTLGSLSFYNMMVKGGIAGVFNEETINEDKADAARWFGNLKSFYLKAFRELKGEDQATYKTLIKNWANGLSDSKVGVNEQPDVLNKIADMFDRKYPHLSFDVDTRMDRIEVTGGDMYGQDVFTFGEELAGQKIFDYEITTRDKEGQDYRVFIVKSSSIGRNAVNSTNEEKPGLWANIRAKQERGEKPARKGSKAYKIAKKAGDEINKDK